MTTIDPRLAAFCRPDGPEVFTAVVHGNQVFGDDPLDVDTIHAEARAAFRRLIDRASGAELPPTGKTLLLLGEAGSGKTHLMRAFRVHAHAHGFSYCGYLQMTSRADNYARYVLANLVDSLQQPYRTGPTGLSRLARGVLDAVTTVSQDERDELVDGGLEHDELARLVHRLSSAVVQHPRFADVDLDVVRVLLYVLVDDGLVHALALKWLRCEELSPLDREVLGGLVPRPGPEMPLRTIVALGRVMWAAQSTALVLLVDQIEEVVELARRDEVAGAVLRGAINTLVDVADALPNAVVVIACLEDLFVAVRRSLPGPKLDRLENDPEPVALVANRTVEEVEALVARRMQALLDEIGIEHERADPIYPFSHLDLAPLAGLRSRDVLDWCRRQHARCIAAGAWVEPEAAVGRELPESRGTPSSSRLSFAWNDFLADWAPQTTLAESTMAELIGWVASSVPDELGDLEVTVSVDRVTAEVSTARGGVRDQLLVAICDLSARGGALGHRIEGLAERAGDTPIAFVRSTPFPRDPKSRISAQLTALCRPVGLGRRVVVENADWRAMEAFRTFADLHREDPGFADWLRADRPLTRLRGVRAVLDLDRIEALRVDAPTEIDRQVATLQDGPTLVAGGIRLGSSRGAHPEPVELDPTEITGHVGFLGGGSTPAAMLVVEGLLRLGIPVLAVDRDGDLCRYADPDAWTEPEPDPARAAVRDQLRDQIPVDLYTPGGSGGRALPLPLLPPDLHRVPESDRDQLASYAAAALGSLMGYRKRSHDARRAILERALAVLGTAHAPVTVPRVEALVRDRDPALLADSGEHDRQFEALADDLQTVWLRHRRLLEAPDDAANPIDPIFGRPGLTVITTRFLGDEIAVDHWLARLLLTIEHWRLLNPGDGLRSALVFDAAERLMPASGRVPTGRAALGTLLGRGRSAGLGVLLASRSPGDLDDRAREQIGTWLVGRVEERAAVGRLRPLLEAAGADADELPGLRPGQFQLIQGGAGRAIEVDAPLLSPRRLADDQLALLAAR